MALQFRIWNRRAKVRSAHGIEVDPHGEHPPAGEGSQHPKEDAVGPVARAAPTELPMAPPGIVVR
jgi:hypothetical protein